MEQPVHSYQGLPQGCVASPVLFSVVPEGVLSRKGLSDLTKWSEERNAGVHSDGVRWALLSFADDVDLSTDSAEIASSMLGVFWTTFRNASTDLQSEKCQWLLVQSRAEHEPLLTEQHVVPQVARILVLGAVILAEDPAGVACRHGLCQALTALWASLALLRRLTAGLPSTARLLTSVFSSAALRVMEAVAARLRARMLGHHVDGESCHCVFGETPLGEGIHGLGLRVSVGGGDQETHE